MKKQELIQPFTRTMMSIEVIGDTKSDQLPTHTFWTQYQQSIYHGYQEIKIPLEVFFDISSYCPQISSCVVMKKDIYGQLTSDAASYGLTFSDNNVVINEASATDTFKNR